MSTRYRATTPIPARIAFDDWSGRRSVCCVVVGESRDRYRVRLTEDGKLAGRNRWGKAGEHHSVPKDAVVIEPAVGKGQGSTVAA